MKGYNAFIISTIVDLGKVNDTGNTGYNAFIISTIVDMNTQTMRLKQGGYNAFIISTIVDKR